LYVKFDVHWIPLYIFHILLFTFNSLWLALNTSIDSVAIFEFCLPGSYYNKVAMKMTSLKLLAFIFDKTG